MKEHALTKIGPTVEVLYSCENCSVIEKPINVRERRYDEDIRHWMGLVTEACARDHMRYCDCHATELTLKIPVPSEKDAYLGKATRQ